MAIGSIMAGVGGILGGLGSAGSLAASLFGDDPEIPVPQGYKSWVENTPDMTAMIQGLMPMSYAQGLSYPTYGGYYRQDPGYSFGGMSSAYPVTQDIYQSYLGGDYGYSPSDIAAQEQGMLAQLGIQGLGGLTSPASIAGASYMDPSSLAQAISQIQGVGYQDQQSYLSQAAQMAQYNKQRAQFLGSLLGSAG